MRRPAISGTLGLKKHRNLVSAVLIGNSNKDREELAYEENLKMKRQ